MSDLTVVIPTFNMQDGAIRAIDSVLNQKMDLEIIVVDDCSSPALKLPSRLEAMANIQLIRHQENRGAGASRNTGVSAAQTEWISFLDSDDRLTDDTLANRLSLAKQHHSTVVGGPTLYGSAWLQIASAKEAWIVRSPVGADRPEDFASGCWYCPGSCIMGTSEVFENHPYDERLEKLEDFDFGIRFGLSGGELVVLDVVGAIIERSNNSDAHQIERSQNLILSKFEGLAQSAPKIWNHLRAYLELEVAAISYGEQRLFKTGYHMLKSLYFKPRLSSHLSPGWKITKAVSRYAH